MASIIRIKRSSSATAPATLGSGELAYSAGSGTQANGGERLYIGFGTEVGGGAPQFVIGGKYFTDLLDHTHGTLTASSALIVDSSSKLDNLKVDNLDLNGNTLSSTDTNGNISLDPNGTGIVSITKAANIGGTLGVTGATTLSSTLGVTGATTLSSTLAVTGDVAINTNKFNITAASGNTTIAGTLGVSGATTLSSTLGVTGDFAIATNKFTVASASGNTVVAGTLQAGATTLDSATVTNNLTVNGTFNSDDITAANISVAGNATITGNLTVQGTTTTVNSTTVAISDKNIELAKDATTAAQADGAGITVTGPTTPATILYNSTSDSWNFNKNITATNFTGGVSGNASTATKWATARDLSLTGDATATLTAVDGTANVSAAVTLATVNSNVGSFGSSTSVATFTVNAKGLITAAGSSSIPIATSSVNGLASFSSSEFTVTSGLVTVYQIDGGTY